ncbi:MAG: 50S ribosomal protein L23 [Candidatus Zixiibacteriota bacterium]|nr:MAG: 50S ribosomal protein L23 [candidate division Zixibacteria bacterium]
MSYDPRKIIKSHVNTERSTKLRETNNEYVFEVDRLANKYTVKMAIQNAFGVKVASVRTMIMPGKTRRIGRNEGKTPTWKKAIVKLKQGEVISMFENM